MSQNHWTYVDLDETDRRIVDLLRQDGRMPYRQIARQLAVSEGMIRKRVQRLLDSSFVRIRAVGDPLQLGVPVLAAIQLTVRPGAVDRVAENLAALDNVRYVAVGIGANNVMIESLHLNVEALHTFLTEVVGGMPEVQAAETFQAVRIVKSVWDWPIPTTEQALGHGGFDKGGE